MLSCAHTSSSKNSPYGEPVDIAIEGVVMPSFRTNPGHLDFYLVEDEAPKIRVCARYHATGSRLARNSCGSTGAISSLSIQQVNLEIMIYESIANKALVRHLAAGNTLEAPVKDERFVLDITKELRASYHVVPGRCSTGANPMVGLDPSIDPTCWFAATVQGI